MSSKRKSKSKKSSQKKEKEKEPDIDPFPDMKDINYEIECSSVREVVPTVFTEKDGPETKKKKLDKKQIKKEINTKPTESKKEIKPNVNNVSEDLKDAIMINMTLGPKRSHPYESKIEGNICIHANGSPGGTLSLDKGKKYVFKFSGKSSENYEIIITRDPFGGKSAALLIGTQPIPIGKSLILVLNKDCPGVVYYHERNKEFMGGVIKVN